MKKIVVLFIIFLIIVCGCWNKVSVEDDVCSKYKIVLEEKYYVVYKKLKNGKDKKILSTKQVKADGDVLFTDSDVYFAFSSPGEGASLSHYSLDGDDYQTYRIMSMVNIIRLYGIKGDYLYLLYDTYNDTIPSTVYSKVNIKTGDVESINKEDLPSSYNHVSCRG